MWRWLTLNIKQATKEFNLIESNFEVGNFACGTKCYKLYQFFYQFRRKATKRVSKRWKLNFNIYEDLYDVVAPG